MRGYGRDYPDRERYLSGGSEIYRDRMRHNPSWEDREYGSRGHGGGGYQGGGSRWGGERDHGHRGDFRDDRGEHWRGRGYAAGGGRSRDYGRDYNDYGQGDYTYGDFSRQYPTHDRGHEQGRGMQGRPNRPQGRGGGRPGYAGDADTDFGMGAGLGSYRSSGSFGNPTSRGDFFTGYGGAIRRGYTPYW